MSKLDEMIKELCPSGVEYKKVSKFAKCIAGATPSKLKREFWENGTIPWMSSGEVNKGEIFETDNKITQAGYDGSSTKLIPPNTVVMALAGQGKTRGMVAITRIELCTNQSLCAFVLGKDVIPEYLLHFFKSRYKDLRSKSNGDKDGSRGGLNLKILNEYIVPIPPVEVQAFIVEMLDNLESKFLELNKLLDDEYMDRKKQYDYYSDKLLSSELPRDKWKAVSDVIVSLKTGLNPRQNFQLNVGGDKPYITGKDIYNNSINISEKTDYIKDEDIALINKRACLENGDVLFASTGTGTVGRMAVVEEYNNDWAVSETMFCLKPKKDIINPYYLMYVLYSQTAKDQFEPKISRGSVPHLKVNDLLAVEIPVPTLEEQNRIIGFMRKYDLIVNSISERIPAEIDARQKQYEYYRERLLTFKELLEND